ncbi:MAG: L-2-amino-thiazoline-4-carboxylic acid hydrolase [Promethearchaeota archaeon]
MKKEKNEFYLRNKDNFVRQFNSLVKVAKDIVSQNYNIEITKDLIKKAQYQFENVLLKLPYVGGIKSPFTSLMIQSAVTFVFYNTCKLINLSDREIGKLIYEIAEHEAQSISPIKKWFYRKVIFSKNMKNRWRYWLMESKKNIYDRNWVGDFIESDRKTYDYGIDFTECGWLKLIENESMQEFAPYVCLCDYARMRGIGIGFKRTKTIAAGAEICDFRFIKNYKTPKGWPPEDLEENKEFYAQLKK